MKFLFTSLLLILCQFLHAQELLKYKVQDPPAGAAWKDSLNKLIKAYNLNPSVLSINKISQFMGRADVKKDSTLAVKTLQRQLDSVQQLKNLEGAVLPLVDSATVDAAAEGTESLQCDKLRTVVNIDMRKNADAEFEVTLQDKEGAPLSGFVLRQLSETLFYEKLQQSFYYLCDGDVAATDEEFVQTHIKKFRDRGLYQQMLEAGLEVNDDDVYAGKLTIRRMMPVRLDNKAAAKTNEKKGGTGAAATNKADREFKIHHVQIQFQDGFIENIKVRGKITGRNELLKFENAYPIPFSTKRDFRKLYDHPIFERTIFAKENKTSRRLSEDNRELNGVFIYLGDLLEFDQNLDLHTKDYSPVNQVVDLNIEQEETTVNLKKERTSKILELRVFTDLKGIEENTPNGLVQFELSKKLNFWNSRKPIFGNLFNAGLFNYITPSFSMTKIENNNKRLAVSYIGSQEPDTGRANVYASTLQLLQYQHYRIGADIAIFTVDVPGIKSVLTFKTGLYFGRTLISDTIRNREDSLTFTPIADNNVNEYGVNSLQFIPEINLQIFPDKRYGLNLSYRMNRYRLLNSRLAQVNDTLDYRDYIVSLNGNRAGINQYDSRRWVGAAEIFAFYRPSTYNQLFFRYTINHDLKRPKTNFHQIQLGFSTYLTHTSKGKKAQARENIEQ